MRPTHVLVATSDGERLTGESWMTLEDFAKLFSPGTARGRTEDGQWFERSVLCVVREVPGAGGELEP